MSVDRTKQVSIILPTYNREQFLQKSIQSVLDQTWSYFELIVVDDGSTDHTEELLHSFSDRRIRYCKTRLNRGAAAARNYGIGQAEYDYIAFEDSDDCWRPDKLKKQMEALKASGEDTGFCYHKICYDMGEGRKAILPSEELAAEQKRGDIYQQLLWDNLVDCPSILMTRACLEDTGLFDEELKALEDYDLALRAAKKYKAAFVDEILLDSTFSNTGVSGNAVNYLLASCRIVQKYKQDYIKTETLNHRLSIILRDAEQIGLKDQFVALLEKIMIA